MATTVSVTATSSVRPVPSADDCLTSPGFTGFPEKAPRTAPSTVHNKKRATPRLPGIKGTLLIDFKAPRSLGQPVEQGGRHGLGSGRPRGRSVYCRPSRAGGQEKAYGYF
jgi:hypothetical protein